MREKLPERRQSETFEIEHIETTGARSPYVLTIGQYPDGRIGEVFVDSPKNGSTLGLICHDAAVLISIALQHGATIEEMRSAVARQSDEILAAGEAPQSVIGSVLDEIARKQVDYDGS
jgi:hypothetical protein